MLIPEIPKSEIEHMKKEDEMRDQGQFTIAAELRSTQVVSIGGVHALFSEQGDFSVSDDLLLCIFRRFCFSCSCLSFFILLDLNYLLS